MLIGSEMRNDVFHRPYTTGIWYVPFQFGQVIYTLDDHQMTVIQVGGSSPGPHGSVITQSTSALVIYLIDASHSDGDRTISLQHPHPCVRIYRCCGSNSRNAKLALAI